MKIVVMGAGKVGCAIAQEVIKEGHDVTLVDSDSRQVEELSSALDCMVLEGNGGALSVQREAGVASSDLMIAATSNDELNIIACILARKLGCKHTIARVRNSEYNEELNLLRKDLGLSMTVNPDNAAAMELFRLLQYPGFTKRESFAKSRAELVALQLQSGNPLCGVKLMDLSKVLKERILVCAVRRGDEVIIPGGTFELQENDEVYVSAPATELSKLLSSLGIRSRKTKNVMLIGGCRIAEMLAGMLSRSGVRVKIIERNKERCRQLAAALPDISVLCGDGTSQSMLRSENISGMDAVVSLTESDEENMFISMYAGMEGVPQTIAKINRSEYGNVCRACGVQYTVSPKDLSAQTIVRYVRAMQNKGGGSVLSLHSLLDGRVEALEFEVEESLPFRGRKLMELKLKPNILIACITRRGRLIYPSGSDTLETGDAVVVVASSGYAIAELRDILKDKD